MNIIRITYSWPCEEKPGIGWPAYYHTKYSAKSDKNIVITAKRRGLRPVEGDVRFIEIPYKTNDLGKLEESKLKKIYLFIKKLFAEITFLNKVRRELKQVKSDIDIVHVYSPIPFLCGVYCKRKYKAQFVMSFHGTDVERVCQSKFYQYILSIPDQIMTVGQSMNEKLSRYPTKRPIETIGNGVDTSVFQNIHLERKKQIVHVANLRWPKGQETLLKAFYLFHRNHNDYQLIIIGEGEKKEQLKNLCREYQIETAVRFDGYQNREYINQELNKSKCFVLSSEIEGFPKVIIEAMATGTPVISTDAGNAREVVGDSGIIVPVNQPEALADAMEQLIFHNDWKTVSNKAQMRSGIYTWKNVYERTEKIYRVLLEGKYE